MAPNITLVIILSLLASYLLQVCSNTTIPHVSESKCNEVCGNTPIPYPFYVGSSACGKSGFKLECYNDSTLRIKLNNVLHDVIDFNDDGISLNLSCSSSVADFSIQGMPNYAISNQNILQLGECENTKSCPLTQMQCSNGEKCSFGRSCCYPLMNDSLWPTYSHWQRGASNFSQFYPMQCKVFTSWVARSLTPNVDAVFGLKLEWAILGNCKNAHCHVNARCNSTTGVKGGVRCSCNQGYIGDGYVEGKGCIKVLACAATSVAISIVFSAIVIYRRRSKVLEEERPRWLQGAQVASLVRKQAREFSTEIFSYRTLNRATKRFAESQQCGRGASGTVYKGFLPDGRHVAIKRIHYYSGSSQQWAHQLLNEIILLSTIKHPNLVQLLGCCLEMEDPILVYEFVPNGTLLEHLNRKTGQGLDWKTRCAIATDAAQAIAYLHNNLNPSVYHRDVKSSNILLDFDFNCKVADFGLSRIAPFDGGTHISTAPQGTPGYLDPEYHQTFHLSEKSDVYSFGVVLVEIISAMKAVDFSREKKEITLSALLVSRVISGCVDDIIDPFLDATHRPRLLVLVRRVIELAFRCLAPEKDSRPTMTEVAQELVEIRRDTECLEDWEQAGDFVSIDDCESQDIICSCSSDNPTHSDDPDRMVQ
ncbi:hypothetical protein SUGI_0094590 [Cryptomeria japonica]|uniref:wall-associated receptor kinase-like 14 n=1 Tax=Cryptomeria japonica TaxID=3369 RepID=UPI002408C847|nr:wall-associated receptor kinase-like 14 [Cryptomeria japonica]GLJ08725.1 hypothetical protein SUGI_0094590 [Cryptomeria japonica]